jgi:hypothetical protein
MQWSDIKFDPPTRTLRQFAALVLIFFAGLALWTGFVHGRTKLGAILAIVAVGIGFLGMLKPRAVRPVFVGWMILAFPIGWIVSHLVLAGLFYLVFTPLAFFFRLTGRDRLQRGFQPEKDSYWTSKPMPADVRRYFEQS